MRQNVSRAVRNWAREWWRRRREAAEERRKRLDAVGNVYLAGRATLEELGSPPEAWLAKHPKKTDSAEAERPSE